MPGRTSVTATGFPGGRGLVPLLAAAAMLLLQACASKPPAPQPQPAPQPPAAAPAPAPEARLIVDAQEYPWSAIGRLNLAGQGFCNGILIGPRQVLTQARCLYAGREARWFQPQELHFIAAYQKDDYLADSKVGNFTVAPGFNPAGGSSLSNITNNWAVVTLSQEIGARTGWLGVEWDSAALKAAATRGDAVYLRAGYRADWAHAITLYFGCAENVSDVAGFCSPTPMEQALTPFVLRGDELRVLGDFYLRSAAESAPLAQLAATRVSNNRLGQASLPAGSSPVRSAPEVSAAILLRSLGYDVDSSGLDSAIAAFRRDHGLSSGGGADVELLRELVTAARNPGQR